LEWVCFFKRKQRGTIVVAFFGVIFAPVLRPATLTESETIAETAPNREPFLFARLQVAIRARQEKFMPA
jgi:hypothetical protein